MLHITATATGGTQSVGVYNVSSSPTMNNVTATATGGTNNRGVYNNASSPTMNNVTATATGGTNNRGVYSFSSSPTMNNVTATATGGTESVGVYNKSASSSTIHSSSITGTTNSILSFGETSSSRVADTILDGPITGPGFACSSVSTLAGVALGPDCLTDRVITVAPQGGHYLKLSTALEAIGTDPKYPAATATDPYLIKIAPGTYDEGTTTVNLKSFVDIEGSGQGATTITCDCASDTDALTDDSSATVSATGPLTAEVRHLTIENTGGDDHSTGVHTTSVVAQSFSLLHVTVEATAGAVSSYGIVNDGSSPAITNATVSGFGPADPRGVSNNGASSPILTNVVVTAGGNLAAAVVNDNGASPTIRGSSITGFPFDIVNISGTAIVTNTALGDVGGGAGFTCVGVHTTAGVALNATCSAETAQPFSVFADGDQALVVTPTDAVVRSVTVTAPVSGTVIVNSSNSVIESLAGDQLRCSITMGSTVNYSALQVWASSGTDAGGLGQMSGTRGFDIAAGAAVMYNLVCVHTGSSGSSTVEDSSLTATFTPNP
ncbi:MAG: hypothetical protein ACJAR2_000987 [Ilumatobacter sp.]|jgi:hypothetical protein